MKKLFLILAIVSNMAQADTWVMPNQGGGQVVLTDRLCQGYKNLYYAYTYTDRVFLDGCWRLMDGRVHVVWDKGQGRKVYEMNDFTVDQTAPKRKGTSL